MPISNSQKAILGLLFDGNSVDQITENLDLAEDRVLTELADALETLRIHTLNEADGPIGADDSEFALSTRH